MNYAIIENGTVVNVVVWDGETEWHQPAGTDMVKIEDDAIGVGFTYDGQTFTAPPPPPEPVIEPITLQEAPE